MRNTYTDVFGETRTEVQSAEEVMVHQLNMSSYKISPNKKRAGYPNEDDIRKEQGMNGQRTFEAAFQEMSGALKPATFDLYKQLKAHLRSQGYQTAEFHEKEQRKKMSDQYRVPVRLI